VSTAHYLTCNRIKDSGFFTWSYRADRLEICDVLLTVTEVPSTFTVQNIMPAIHKGPVPVWDTSAESTPNWNYGENASHAKADTVVLFHCHLYYTKSLILRCDAMRWSYIEIESGQP